MARSDKVGEGFGGGGFSGPIGSVSRGGPTGRVGYKVSENVRVVAPNKSSGSVKVSSGAQQAASENVTGKFGKREAPSSPTKGANMGKPNPGTQKGHTVTKVNRKTGRSE